MRKKKQSNDELWQPGDDSGPGPEHDVEGHGADGESFLHRFPGTGGDQSAPRRPWGTGELTDDKDVEGHALNRLPGTGGDQLAPRRPWGTGELTDDEGPNRVP